MAEVEVIESVKAALIAFDLRTGASPADIRAQYLAKTAQNKFLREILLDERLQREFTEYYKAYVTLVKHHQESGGDANADYYPQDPEEMFQYYLNQGIYYFINQNYIKAGEKFQEAFKLNNKHVLLLNYLGVLLLKRKSYYAAEKYFKNAVTLDKDCEDTWFYLGESYFKAGELKKALAAYETSQKLNPARSETAYRIKEIKETMRSKFRRGKKPSLFAKVFKKPGK